MSPESSPISAAPAWLRRHGRIVAAAFIVLIALLAACVFLVEPGQAVVVTRIGNPVRVQTSPGLGWRIPAPIETTIAVDLRLKTTSSGLQDVGTRDGLRILVQAYMAWQVPDDPQRIRQFLRAVRNQPDVAADQLRSFVASALEITVSGFDLAALVNTDATKVRLKDLEARLLERLDEQALNVYGVKILQVGLERLTLPSETLQATVQRMAAERHTVAAQRQADGERAAAEIVSNADRDARVLLAKAQTDAAAMDAKSRVDAAAIYAKSYGKDRDLFTTLRSLDTLSSVVQSNTTLVLRSDAAPFRILVDGPGATAGAIPAAKANGAAR